MLEKKRSLAGKWSNRGRQWSVYKDIDRWCGRTRTWRTWCQTGCRGRLWGGGLMVVADEEWRGKWWDEVVCGVVGGRGAKLVAEAGCKGVVGGG